MDKLKGLKEDRVEKEDELTALTDKAEKETLSADEKSKMKSLVAEIEEIDDEIETLEKAEKLSTKKAAKQPANPALKGAEQNDESEFKELVSIAKRFSLGRALKSTFGQKDLDGVELEVRQIAQAEAKDSGVELTGNIAIPEKFIQIGKCKQLTVGTEGADVVFTEYGGKVIPYLNPEPAGERLGVTFLQGLRGDVQWPRETGDLTFAFETETSDVNESIPTFDNISISPKRFGGYVDITLQMLQQSIFVIDPWIRGKLNLRYALTIDDQIFNGTGSGNQTTGLFNFSGVNTLSLGSSGGDMTYNALLTLMRDAEVANARMGKSGFVTNAYGKYALATTPKQTSGVEGNFIFNPKDGSLIGEPFVKSNIIPSTFTEGAQSDLVGMAYSTNWGGLICGLWGGMDMLFDPYTQRLGGKVRFVVNGFMDIDIEQPLEFSICKDWDATDAPAAT